MTLQPPPLLMHLVLSPALSGFGESCGRTAALSFSPPQVFFLNIFSHW